MITSLRKMVRRLNTLEEDIVSIAGKAALIDTNGLGPDEERLIREILKIAQQRAIERYTYMKEGE